jgi:hypothetical protein
MKEPDPATLARGASPSMSKQRNPTSRSTGHRWLKARGIPVIAFPSDTA